MIVFFKINKLMFNEINNLRYERKTYSLAMEFPSVLEKKSQIRH